VIYVNVDQHNNGEQHKISQYADDTTIALDVSPKSLFAALRYKNYIFNFLWIKHE
jgi:hypothetical protein